MHSQEDSRALKGYDGDDNFTPQSKFQLYFIWSVLEARQAHPPVVDGVGLFERRRHAIVEEQVPMLGDLPVLPKEGKLRWVILICSEKFP